MRLDALFPLISVTDAYQGHPHVLVDILFMRCNFLTGFTGWTSILGLDSKQKAKEMKNTHIVVSEPVWVGLLVSPCTLLSPYLSRE